MRGGAAPTGGPRHPIAVVRASRASAAGLRFPRAAPPRMSSGDSWRTPVGHLYDQSMRPPESEAPSSPPSVCLSVLENSGSLSGGPVRSLESRHPGLRFSSCCVTRTSGTALVWRRIGAPLGPPRSLPCHVHGRRNTCGPAGTVEDTRERNGDRPAWLRLQLRKMIRWKKGEHIGFPWCKKEL